MGKFRYINDIRAASEREKKASSTGYHSRILIVGHLFDKAFINGALDILETTDVLEKKLMDWNVGQNIFEETSVLLVLCCKTEGDFRKIYQKLQDSAEISGIKLSHTTGTL